MNDVSTNPNPNPLVALALVAIIFCVPCLASGVFIGALLYP